MKEEKMKAESLAAVYTHTQVSLQKKERRLKKGKARQMRKKKQSLEKQEKKKKVQYQPQYYLQY